MRGDTVVLIGDPLQLRAVGVGGAFAAVHRITDGETLSENRRQRDEVERQALEQWREGRHRDTLQAWADSGRLHVATTADEARVGVIGAWARARTQWADPHDRIAGLLLLAHTNLDVDLLNRAARKQLIAAGELDDSRGHVYNMGYGRSLRLAVGDQVLVRVNDRRESGDDVLNGHRGVVDGIDEHGNAAIVWRQPGPDGPRLAREWVTADYVTAGGVAHGYAITASKAQGLTADRALVYGAGMDAHVLYPAMSRDRHRADLWLALEPLEDIASRVRLGDPDGDAQLRHRAAVAYAARLAADRPDGLVLDELGDDQDPGCGERHGRREQVRQYQQALAADRAGAQDAARAGVQHRVGDWSRRLYGDYTDAQLTAATVDAQRRLDRATRQVQRHLNAARDVATAVRDGRGEQVTAWQREHGGRDADLVEAVEKVRAARLHAERLRQRQDRHQAAAAAAYAEAEQHAAQAARSRLALRMAGLNREQLHAAAEAARRRGDAQIAAARAVDVDLQRVQAKAADTQPARLLAAHRAGRDAGRAAAQARDEAALEPMMVQARQVAATTEPLRKRVEQLHAEATYRDQHAPDRARPHRNRQPVGPDRVGPTPPSVLAQREAADRGREHAAQQRRLAAQRAAQEREERAVRERYYRPPQRDIGGPSLGR